MIALILLLPTVGAALGLRFKMLVLVPAMLLVGAVTVGFGIAIGQGAASILLMLFGDLALLQIGYFIGCVLRAYLTFKSQDYEATSRSSFRLLTD
jgi:hypothetical protein